MLETLQARERLSRSKGSCPLLFRDVLPDSIPKSLRSAIHAPTIAVARTFDRSSFHLYALEATHNYKTPKSQICVEKKEFLYGHFSPTAVRHFDLFS